jgi:hypothetical protein
MRSLATLAHSWPPVAAVIPHPLVTSGYLHPSGAAGSRPVSTQSRHCVFREPDVDPKAATVSVKPRAVTGFPAAAAPFHRPVRHRSCSTSVQAISTALCTGAAAVRPYHRVCWRLAGYTETRNEQRRHG